jgi:hypothetical protein
MRCDRQAFPGQFLVLCRPIGGDPLRQWTKRFPNPFPHPPKRAIEVRPSRALEELGESVAVQRFRELGRRPRKLSPRQIDCEPLRPKKEAQMRFMMSLPAPAEVREAFKPSWEVVTAMRKYSDDMRKAGVLLLAEGLHPSSQATRIQVSNGRRVVSDGPFTEAKEMIAGFWMIQVKSREEALEWANRCPLPEGGVVEIRPVFENADFPPELREQRAGA